MSRLANANVTSRVVRALKRFGFEEYAGSKHTIMTHPDGRYTTVPRHPRINPMLLKKILKQCGIGEDEFIRNY
ncbi:MAG TPA: type II toxin-antitoxin system HicA family toxin [Phycisphaerae bacterium]|nr:type II toxin-antitoxin system HicA family toxin [Phycisphaerae bacterium]